MLLDSKFTFSRLMNRRFEHIFVETLLFLVQTLNIFLQNASVGQIVASTCDAKIVVINFKLIDAMWPFDMSFLAVFS